MGEERLLFPLRVAHPAAEAPLDGAGGQDQERFRSHKSAAVMMSPGAA
jgi:hypothetical protein